MKITWQGTHLLIDGEGAEIPFFTGDDTQHRMVLEDCPVRIETVGFKLKWVGHRPDKETPQ